MKPLLILLLLSVHFTSGQIENSTAAEPDQFPYAVQVHRNHHRRALRHYVDREFPLHGSVSGRVDRRRGELAAGGGEGRKVLVRVAGEGGRT